MRDWTPPLSEIVEETVEERNHRMRRVRNGSLEARLARLEARVAELEAQAVTAEIVYPANGTPPYVMATSGNPTDVATTALADALQ